MLFSPNFKLPFAKSSWELIIIFKRGIQYAPLMGWHSDFDIFPKLTDQLCRGLRSRIGSMRKRADAGR